MKEKIEEMEMPVLFVLDSTKAERALIFGTINGNQRQVPASVIYDLFDLSEKRSPEKIAHLIARNVNSIDVSPFWGRLKMLGYKAPGSDQRITQGLFVKNLLSLFNEKKTNFLYLYLNNKDEYILRYVIQIFNSVKNVWPDEWEDKNSILSKSVGVTGIFKAFPFIIDFCDKNIKDNNESFVICCDQIFSRTKQLLSNKHKPLISSNFAGGSGANMLKDYILEAIGSLQ